MVFFILLGMIAIPTPSEHNPQLRMIISFGHQNHSNVETQHSKNSEALSLLMRNLLGNASKIEIVSDNAKKGASDCKFKQHCNRLSIRRNQRWEGDSNAGGITSPSSSSSSSTSQIGRTSGFLFARIQLGFFE
jgi:hypothetical protein